MDIFRVVISLYSLEYYYFDAPPAHFSGSSSLCEAMGTPTRAQLSHFSPRFNAPLSPLVMYTFNP
jgi:hypothetical protein